MLQEEKRVPIDQSTSICQQKMEDALSQKILTESQRVYLIKNERENLDQESEGILGQEQKNLG